MQSDVDTPTPHRPPVAVRRALQKLDEDLRDARKRRGLTAEIVAEGAFASRPTLQRIEEGDDGVGICIGIGIYAAVLNALGLLDRLGTLADPARDTVGQQLSTDSLPERLRVRRPKTDTPR